MLHSQVQPQHSGQNIPGEDLRISDCLIEDHGSIGVSQDNCELWRDAATIDGHGQGAVVGAGTTHDAVTEFRWGAVRGFTRDIADDKVDVLRDVPQLGTGIRENCKVGTMIKPQPVRHSRNKAR